MTQWMAAVVTIVSPPPVTTHTAPAPVLGCVMADLRMPPGVVVPGWGGRQLP